MHELYSTDTPVTERQNDALEAVSCFIADRGYSPSIQDVADAMRISKPTASRHLHLLRDKGQIVFDDRVARSIRLTNQSNAA